MANLAGLHDIEGIAISPQDTWLLDTIPLSNNPAPRDYTQIAPGRNIIVRLNWGYGSTGTLPIPAKYTDFAERVANYVRLSKGCTRWQIGNEPNLSREWPAGQPIFPWHYALCYKLCREFIHDLQGRANDEVLIAGSGPWNAELKYPGNENGDWIKYFEDVIDECHDEVDGFVLHAYTHGYNVSLVTSSARMSPPFQHRHYEFRTYRDYMQAIPLHLEHLPVYIGEANGNGPWQAVGLMPAMLNEIDNWNKVATQPIKSVIFYRYPKYDEYFIEGRGDVIAEYQAAVEKGYIVPETYLPAVESQPKTPTAKVNVPSGANIRTGPGMSYHILGAVPLGKQLAITGRTSDSSWWRVQSEMGDVGWVSDSVVETYNTQNVPVVTVTVPIDNTQPSGDLFSRCLDFVLRWEGGWADNPNDPGGATMKGITIGTYTRWREAHGQPRPTKEELRNISDSEVRQIYHDWYWKASGADKLPWPMNLAQFDLAVNGGTGRAQEALTAAGNNFNKYMAWRLDWYTRLDGFTHFGRAWTRRCADLIREAG